MAMNSWSCLSETTFRMMSRSRSTASIVFAWGQLVAGISNTAVYVTTSIHSIHSFHSKQILFSLGPLLLSGTGVVAAVGISSAFVSILAKNLGI